MVFRESIGFSGGSVLAEKLELERLRNEIATVTFEILDLCRKRIELARKIARFKAKRGLPIENLEIENALKRRVLDFCHRNNMNDEFCIKLFNLLINESKRVQEEAMKAGFREESPKWRAEP